MPSQADYIKKIRMNGLRRVEKTTSDIHLRYTILALMTLKTGRVHEIVEKAQELLERDGLKDPVLANYKVSERTTYRKLKELLAKKEVQKDQYHVYSITKTGKSNVDNFPDLFGRELLTMGAFGDFDIAEDYREIPEISRRFGMYLMYLILFGLEKFGKYQPRHARLSTSERARLLNEWLRNTMDVVGMQAFVWHMVPSSITQKKGQKWILDLDRDQQQDLSNAFRREYPRFFAKAELSYRNFAAEADRAF